MGAPQTFEARWLEGALQVRPGSIEDVDVRSVGTGQVAASYRLKIQGARYEGPASVIAKGPSLDAASRRTGFDRNLYLHELSWYQTYARLTDARCPQHLYSEYSEAGEGFVLLLEDCTPARQGDQLEGAPKEAVQNALREAARLHGAFLRRPDIVAGLEVPASPDRDRQRIVLFQTCWAAFKQRHGHQLTADILDWGDAFASRYTRYLHRPPTVRSVIHRDFRLDNLLFGQAGERAILLDWQTYSAGHPMSDVAYLIGTSLADPRERASIEHSLLETYFEHLTEIVPDENLDPYWDEYRVSAFSGFVMAVISSSIVAQTGRGDRMFLAMADRSARQAMDLNSLSLL